MLVVFKLCFGFLFISAVTCSEVDFAPISVCSLIYWLMGLAVLVKWNVYIIYGTVESKARPQIGKHTENSLPMVKTAKR